MPVARKLSNASANGSNGSNGHTKRAYGHSCLACRQKKISCDARRPKCSGCVKTDEDCQYKSSRPLRTLNESGGDLKPDFGVTIQTGQQRFQRMDERLARVERLLGIMPGLSSRAGSPVRRVRSPKPDSSEPEAPGPSRFRLRQDETGNVVCYGVTGFWQGSELNQSAARLSPEPTAVSDPVLAQFYEALASGQHQSVTPEFGKILLDCYFSYQVFDTLDRSLFIRDMALGGQHFSDFLLMAVYALGTRMIDGLATEDRAEQSEAFAKLARDMLAQELLGPSKLATAQGLLLMSSRECAIGASTLGWTHAGMAFRLIHDLGIHLPPDKVVGTAHLTAEDRHARERLFWSAMIWDKCISLALGREPTFQPRRGHDPSHVPDANDDENEWVPHFVNPANRPTSLIGYSSRPAKRTSAFRDLARLSLILHDVLVEMYSPESELDGQAQAKFRTETAKRLQQFYDNMESPHFNSEFPCPPPWVFMTLMLYHAAWILIYRPPPEADTTPDPADLAICLHHNGAIQALAISYQNTFARRMPYVAMYSAYVAMSFDVALCCNAKALQIESLERLRSWFDVLRESATQSPGIRKSLHTLSEMTCNVVSQNPMMACSEPGQWLLREHADQQPQMSPVTPMETGDLDFLQILGMV